jgi:NADPH-dependent 2,4-dienoyl-CoA reductase/sulfur reductase-like enzyme
MSAAAKAKRTNREIEVIVYERGRHISYAACGAPYFIAGDVPDYHELIVRTPEQMRKQGVLAHIRHEVSSIDSRSRTVTVHNLDGGHEFLTEFDRLVIATGAHPAQVRLPGSALPGIFTLRSLATARAIHRFLAEHNPRHAVIVGGGYIAVEMAETFRRLGLEVTMLIRSGKVLRTTLDDDTRDAVQSEFSRHGVKVIQSTPVAFEGTDRLEAIVTGDGSFSCEAALLGMGAQPNVQLAQAAGVALGTTGAIATDSHMRTSLPNIYAAGDCAEAMHLVTGKPAYIPLGSTANKQGRVAGTNAGGGSATFAGVVGTMVVRAFDLAVATTGLSTSQAKAEGYDTAETLIQAKDISHYFPGAADIRVKLVVDTQTSRLLGGQIVGHRRVAKRIDVLATALHNRMTIQQLQGLDLGYAPPFAPVWDPVLVAANIAAR